MTGKQTLVKKSGLVRQAGKMTFNMEFCKIVGSGNANRKIECAFCKRITHDRRLV